MTVAEYILQRLTELGVAHLFAVPGDYASPFLKALDASTIERIPTLTELGAGYAADGYARYQGIGAFSVQYGVGTFTALNCVAGSYVERLPVVVITGSPTTNNRIQERTQGVLFHHSTGDLAADQKVYTHVTAASIIVTDPAHAPAQIDDAFVAMLTHHRPIYIEVLQNVWSLPCSAPTGTLSPIPATSDPDALDAAVAAAWAQIQAARHPVLWLGVEIQRYGFQSVAQGIIDAGGLPFTTTSLGKTTLDESQPAFLGTYSGPASPLVTRELMLKTDLPIALGTIITDDYLDIMNTKFGEMIEATDEEIRVGYARFSGVTLSDFLQRLLDAFLAADGFPRTLPPHGTDDTVTAGLPDTSLTYNIFYQELATYLEPCKAQIALILGESTSLYVFGNLFGLPANSFVAQAAWGSLGHETGCALGVALGSGKRPIVVAGDGGFAMVCQELSSLARASVPAVVFVMSNEGYAIEQAFVDITAFEPGHSFAPFDILPKWDYLALAQAFGVQGFRVTTVAELHTVLDAVSPLKVPALVQVVIPQNDLAPQLERLANDPVVGGIPGLNRADRPL
ncbi:MAG: pyruvate decarboxylase [Chthonomonadales bacterium]|nr:pyruvate decarboxylase [Chthonomonadales bacterium]